MIEQDKPCGRCSFERRDACWKGKDFACEEYYRWVKNGIKEWLKSRIKEDM